MRRRNSTAALAKVHFSKPASGVAPLEETAHSFAVLKADVLLPRPRLTAGGSVNKRFPTYGSQKRRT